MYKKLIFILSVFQAILLIQVKAQVSNCSGGHVKLGPGIYIKYAAGTEITHEVTSHRFEDFIPAVPKKLCFYRIVNNDHIYDGFIQGEIIGTIAKSYQHDAGFNIRMNIHPYAKPGRWVIKFAGSPKDNPDRQEEIWAGAFEVIERFKTVIITVDGLAYGSIDKLLKSPVNLIPAFKKIFSDGINYRALSALPTVTWCNWPGIFSGQPPKDHGVLGNAFLERERKEEPFATGNLTKWDGFMATKGVLTAKAKDNAESLYDQVASSLPGGRVKVLSIHQWYTKHSWDKVELNDLYFPRIKYHINNITLLGHSASTAKLMDEITRDEAVKFCKNPESWDIMTLYFPGPDNVAHAVGDKKGVSNAVGYKPGPNLPDNTNPLLAIGQHLREHTDKCLNEVLKAIESQGYLYSTLFVLTADHGLHAFNNTDNFNLTLNKGFRTFFESLNYTVFTNGPGQNIKRANIVYAPNGGMAHIYIRDENRSVKTWKDPPATEEIEKVAKNLFMEAMGGSAIDPKTNQPVKYNRTLNYSAMWPKSNPVYKNAIDAGALGSPPAIFVKICNAPECQANNFLADFQWVKFVNEDGHIMYGTIAEFISARKKARKASGELFYPNFEWPEFEQRLNEMNDKNPAGSRTGDVVFFTDGNSGYMAINDGDELNGWHGGPSESESYVPLFFNIPGKMVVKDFIKKAVDNAYAEIRNSRTNFRNWDLSRVLTRIYKEFYSNSNKANTGLSTECPAIPEPISNVGNTNKPYVRTTKPNFSISEKITVEFGNLPANITSWLTIARQGNNPSPRVARYAVNNKATGKIDFNSLPEGDYELRLFFDNDENIITSQKKFKVSSLTTQPVSNPVNQPVQVQNVGVGNRICGTELASLITHSLTWHEIAMWNSVNAVFLETGGDVYKSITISLLENLAASVVSLPCMNGYPSGKISETLAKVRELSIPEIKTEMAKLNMVWRKFNDEWDNLHRFGCNIDIGKYISIIGYVNDAYEDIGTIGWSDDITQEKKKDMLLNLSVARTIMNSLPDCMPKADIPLLLRKELPGKATEAFNILKEKIIIRPGKPECCCSCQGEKGLEQNKYSISYYYTNGLSGSFYAVLKSNGKWDYIKGTNKGLIPEFFDYGTWKITGTDIVLTWKEEALYGTFIGKFTSPGIIDGTMKSSHPSTGTWLGVKVK